MFWKEDTENVHHDSGFIKTGFVFSSSEFNSMTALSMKPTSQLGS